MMVILSVAALVSLALAVGGLPTREEVPVAGAEGEGSRAIRQPDKWSQLDSEERMSVLEDIEKEVGSPVGSVFITLGNPDSPYRLSKDDSHLFDSYGLMFPGSPLPYVLLTPAASSDPDELPPPFQTPPLYNIPIGKDFVEPDAEVSGTNPTPNQRIPGFVYYNGVPMLVPRALGKIPIKMATVRRMIAHRELDQ
ncbi:hypothetical protein GE061_019109 [Apolygus lucorum]|uniref:Uncharacterized protein n=1 Tax=Apolygus lucorum TaxID=248454 RepID=A0A6A4JGJ0_APOLU|nr:hypothetical protein GE061_019109 [Apolygus lucorum]